MRLEIITVKIVGLPIYECSVCGIKKTGGTVRLELTSVEPAELAQAVNNVSPSHIPIGWVCYGREDIRCPKHVYVE